MGSGLGDSVESRNGTWWDDCERQHRTKNHLTWHEVNDGKIMRLVPTETLGILVE
ncbi:HNH endonuclease [Rossellomorea marisflavi]|uniref:HNH endonuclease n=1 Tax=Rossellomorea marisflavi TaxID=189381 RepID=UPI003D2F1F88